MKTSVKSNPFYDQDRETMDWGERKKDLNTRFLRRFITLGIIPARTRRDTTPRASIDQRFRAWRILRNCPSFA